MFCQFAAGMVIEILYGTSIYLELHLQCFICIKPLCLIFGATENILPYALRYGRIIVIGFPLVIISICMNAVIRADGSPCYAMASMLIGAVLNTILDLVCIMVLGWNVQGAAIATGANLLKSS
ncbi:MAG TPA: hypothetical protein DDY31_14645 [Lachnospiraceae bacterium]|nr:hypothetical protein [Lachnospiraceae bacterium]